MHGNRQGHGVLRVVSEVCAREPQKSFSSRAGCGQHQERQRDLDRNHDAMTPPALGIADDAPRAGLCDAAEVRARELQRRPDTEDDRRHDGQCRAEQQHRQVHLDDRFGRERVGRHPGNDQRKAFPGDQDSEHRAGDGDHQRFGQELLHDPDSCGAKGRPHRKFLLAVRATDEQQDRDVGTADQQQRCDRTQQQKQPWAHRPRKQFDDAAELNAKRVGVPARCLRGELLQDGLQFGIGLCDRHARADLERHAVVDIGLEPDFERHVNVRFAPAKSRRHDADDLIVLAHELQGPADHGRVARVIPLPELIAEHHDARRVLTRRSVSRNQPSPHERGIAPMIWRVRIDVRRRHIFGDIAIGRREIPPILRDDALDSPGLAKLLDLRATHARPAEASGRIHERDCMIRSAPR